MAGQLKVNGVTLATEESGTVTLENPQIKDSSNNLVLDQSGSRPVLKNVDIKDSSNNVILDQSGTNPVLKNVEVVNNSSMMFRNKIINGDMRISQRGDVTGITLTTYGGPDRFQSILGTAGTWSLSKSTDAPSGSGFSNSFKFECTTANNSLSASSIFEFGQKIEGQNVQDLAYGTSSAKNVTLSFWVKSNLTGTYILEFFNGGSRQINRSYTINAANTWEHKSVTIPGDTSSALANDNNAGFSVYWWLVAGSDYTSGTLNTSAWANNTNADRAVGQVNLASSTSNEFYITGVQLEVGTVATPFEHRPYGLELSLCQRYYEKSYPVGTAPGTANAVNSIYTQSSGSNNYFFSNAPFFMEKRASPTLQIYNPDTGALNEIRDPNSGSAKSMSSDGGAGSLGTRTWGFFYSSAAVGDNTRWHYHFTLDAEL